ncbi:MAG: hypothetical protein V4591_10560, partial [Bdellovibrionota bacterium]
MHIVLRLINQFKDTSTRQILALFICLFCLAKSYPLETPTSKIVSFNKNKPVALEINLDIEKNILTCELSKKNEPIGLYEEKWILSQDAMNSQQKNKAHSQTKEIYNHKLELSLAKDFNFITCEVTAFDGLLFKKLSVSKKIYQILTLKTAPYQVELVNKKIENEKDHLNTKKEPAKEFKNISSSLFIQTKDQLNYSCFVPNEFKKNGSIHTYWYIDNNIIKSSINDDIYVQNNDQHKWLTCVFLAQNNSTLYYGAKNYKLENNKYLRPSWIKNTFLVDLTNSNYKEYLFKENLDNIKCQVISPDNKIVMQDVCKKEGDKYYLSIS